MKNHWGKVLIAGILASITLLIVVMVNRPPCIKWETRTRKYCSMYMPSSDMPNTICLVWDNEDYLVCVEREAKKE